MTGPGWPGLDPHLSLASLLVALGILDFVETPAGEATFVQRHDAAACDRLRRLLDLIADHDAHGWPPEDVQHRELQALFPDSDGAA